MNNSTAILTLILCLLAITALTVWWPNPADRQVRPAADAEGTDK
ncbi:hypothetical protein [Nocardia caishijiensis]|uniref:Uncharacterized protein n=1 Tax=Nocardia caishijiensis TaxID=184756 RepID=A0ABQ6YFE3_9NOCA|nr:hypothetical protein [Nocardia caishijiensis]KAF0836708.1 hypothetical protein FNL39_11223 [Nocardia caishijiensis]